MIRDIISRFRRLLACKQDMRKSALPEEEAKVHLRDVVDTDDLFNMRSVFRFLANELVDPSAVRAIPTHRSNNCQLIS